MSKKLFLCSKAEILKKKIIIKELNEIKDEVIIFVDENNELKIFSSICPHFGGEINYDNFKKKLICKWHGWEFSKETGKCLTHPIKGKLNTYDFEVNPNKLNKYKYSETDNEVYILYE